jgi:hypothetical protein
VSKIVDVGFKSDQQVLIELPIVPDLNSTGDATLMELVISDRLLPVYTSPYADHGCSRRIVARVSDGAITPSVADIAANLDAGPRANGNDRSFVDRRLDGHICCLCRAREHGGTEK